MEPHIHKGERIAKVIARAGVCSRRDAEKLVHEGRVSVNGEVIKSSALNVQPSDKILVDGAEMQKAETTRVFVFHKPAGVLCTANDPQGRPSVFDLLPRNWPRTVSVGRLDMNTEGLLVFTNDGALARYMELPATGLKRTYRARVHGFVNVKRLESLKKGVTVERVRYGPIEAHLEEDQKSSNSWLVVTLQEGKNREVRKVMAHLGLTVNRLVRLKYGPFELGSLPKGRGVEVPIKFLKSRLHGYYNPNDTAPKSAAEAAATPKAIHKNAKLVKSKNA